MPKENEPSQSEAKDTGTSKDAEDDDTAGLPVDRGYAWVIVFACLSCNVLSLGMQRAMGILFVEFLVLFQMSAGETTLILAAQSGCTSVAALLTQTVVLSLLSERQTMILGGLCGGLGFILSYFATSLYHLLFTQSLLLGVSHAMVYGPSCVIVSKYFRKRRSLATAVNALGGNLGSMSMPVFTQALLTLYGVKGTMLVLGAFYFHACVAAGFLRPLDQYRRRLRQERRRRRLLDDQTSDQLPLNEDTGNADTTAAPHPVSEDVSLSGHSSPLKRLSTGRLFASTEVELFIKQPGSDTEKDAGEISEEGEQETTFIGHEIQGNGTTATAVDNSEADRTSLVGNDPGKNLKQDQKINQQSDDVASSSRRHEHKEDCDSGSPRRNDAERKSQWSKLMNMFDFHMLKKLPFWIIAWSFTLSYLPATLFGTYLPAMAVDKGVTGQRAALLLTIFGGCGIFARLGFGWFADLNHIPRYALVALLITVACTAGLFTPLFTQFGHLAAFSVIYGVFGIVVFSIFPVVMVDLLGLRGMSKAFGFVQLFEGVLIAGAHPIIGLLRDVTGNYHASFYFMSSAGLLCAFILMFTPCALRHEKRRLLRTYGDTAELGGVTRPLES